MALVRCDIGLYRGFCGSGMVEETDVFLVSRSTKRCDVKKFLPFLAVFGLILVAIVAVKKSQSGESKDIVKEKLVSVPEDLKKAVSS